MINLKNYFKCGHSVLSITLLVYIIMTFFALQKVNLNLHEYQKDNDQLFEVKLLSEITDDSRIISSVLANPKNIFVKKPKIENTCDYSIKNKTSISFLN
jgi:competence protein ComGF